jgi:hypothetical protein
MSGDNLINSAGKDEWVDVSVEEAKKHSLYGIGGWAFVMGTGLLVPLSILYYIGSGWALTLVVIVVAWQFYKKSKYFYGCCILACSLFLFLSIVGLFSDYRTFSVDILTVSAVAIFSVSVLCYVILSRRIHVTFLGQVKTSELHQVWDSQRADYFIENGSDWAGASASQGLQSKAH